MTKTVGNPEDTFDMYKYCMDGDENVFFLEKRYPADNQSYQTRKNTLGRLWVRLGEQPFAFPAFSGSHPNVVMDQRAHSIVAKLLTDVGDEMRCFYDL